MNQQATDSNPSTRVLRIEVRRPRSNPSRGIWGPRLGQSRSLDLADALLLRLDGFRVTLAGVSA